MTGSIPVTASTLWGWCADGEAGTEIVRFKIYLVNDHWWAKVGSMTKLRGNPRAVLVVVSLGFFMTLLDKTFPGAKTFDQRYRSS
jgi:hypothetical protein